MNWSDILYCPIDFWINRSKLKPVVSDLLSATKKHDSYMQANRRKADENCIIEADTSGHNVNTMMSRITRSAPVTVVSKTITSYPPCIHFIYLIK